MTAGQPIGRCPEHGIPLLVCRVSGPCAQERRHRRALERHARALEKEAGPDAETGRKVRGGARKGGNKRRKIPPERWPDVFADLVRLRDEGNLKYRAACRDIAPKYGVQRGRTIDRLVKEHRPALQWYTDEPESE